MVDTGNSSNAALLDLFTQHLDAVVDAFTEADLVELTESARFGGASARRLTGRIETAQALGTGGLFA